MGYIHLNLITLTVLAMNMPALIDCPILAKEEQYLRKKKGNKARQQALRRDGLEFTSWKTWALIHQINVFCCLIFHCNSKRAPK
jgi:hypothetical protein